MSRITHTQIMITKNPLLKVPVVVPQWEAHVLLALWGEDAQVTGTVVIDREIPEKNDEFTRLANKYGPRDEDIPFVARVYGSFGPGLRGLSQEFEASIAGTGIASVAGPDNAEPLEIDRSAFADADPTVLAGFEGSRAPAKPVDIVEGVRVAVVDAANKLIAVPAGEIPTLAVEDQLTRAEGAEELKIIEPGTEVLTDAQLDAIDVDSLAGNTIDGKDVETFLKSDVSDLTGGDEA